MNYSPHILIVDDNQGIHRDFGLAFLNESENPELQANEERVFGNAAKVNVPKPVYELEHALNGLEGIEKVKQALAREHPFQLAFVDIRMPGIDGVDTVERMWKFDPSIQVVFCTAYADYSWGDLARRLGHTDKALVLKKPFDYIEVIQMASTLTEKWFLARQAALKLEQMELLVAQRTQKLLELQRCELERLRELVPDKTLLTHTVQNPSASPTIAGATNEAVNENSTTGADTASADKELALILLIGDNSNIRQHLSNGLATPCRVIEVPEGAQGLEHARELVPDLVIASDIMPQVDGCELCRRLKNDEMACHIPVILVGTDGLGNRKKALEAGAEEYIVKSVEPSVLRARVNALLQTSHTLQGAFNQKTSLQPRDIATNQVDARFLRRTTEVVETHMADFEFDVEELAQKMFMSRRQLLRKLKSVAGCSPNVFIRALRLQRAAQLLRSSGMTVTEITYAVGFSDLKHFRAIFREQFGVSPAEYGRAAE